MNKEQRIEIKNLRRKKLNETKNTPKGMFPKVSTDLRKK